MKLGVETIWQDRKRVLGMPLTFTKYFLSEDRLFLQTGVLNMKMEEVLLYRVSDIGVHVSLGQRIFGVGTIIIHSSDKSAPHLELKNVKNPLVVKEPDPQARGVHEDRARRPCQRIPRRRTQTPRPLHPAAQDGALNPITAPRAPMVRGVFYAGTGAAQTMRSGAIWPLLLFYEKCCRI